MASLQPVMLVTPHGGHPGGSVAFSHEREMVIVPGDETYRVHDPLFEVPYTVGDRSHFPDPTVDAYVKAFIDYFSYLGSIRQLIMPERYEGYEGTGRWTTKQHSVSAAATTQALDGDPLHIMYAATHDAAKPQGGHRTDDLLGPRGKEDAHDHARTDFIVRSGFARYLLEQGLIDVHGKFTDSSLDLSLRDVTDIPQENSLINMPGKTGDLEYERIQYRAQEAVIRMFGPIVAREMVGAFYRDRSSPMGDQLISSSLDAAITLALVDIRCRAELWGELMEAVKNELVQTRTRFMLIHEDEVTDSIRKYDIANSLRILEEDFLDMSDNMSTQIGRDFNGAIEKIVVALTGHQREARSEYGWGKRRYDGPIAPDWLKIHTVASRHASHKQQTVCEVIDGSVTELCLQIQPGKARHVNPLVLDGRLKQRWPQRLYEIRPWIASLSESEKRWSRQHNDVVIDLAHPKLKLTMSEREALRRGLGIIEERWVSVLECPTMPADKLEKQIRDAGLRYKQIGQLPLEHHTSRLLGG